ncbi:hybrid sensor histidine kinase/response regulator [Verticiella sediminum]|uniref:hybrid sensor histidine kinase/response regulator n=1 Tax=Verticiella sediminum TaxID=1247510 RepID=UPI0014793C67|nr:response regulator [Verticiella sediminum]
MSPTPLILNVDDGDGARYAKGHILRKAGYGVIDAASARAAFDAIARQRPDLVLLDVKLPDMDGRDVCRRLKADPATAGIVVLQTSAALIDSDSRVRAFDAGADGFLVEPIEPEELVANVRALLRLQRAERARDESESRLREMAGALADVFWVYHAGEGRFEYVSPAYERHWGCDAASLYQDAAAWFAHVHPDDRDILKAHFTRLGDGAGYEAEYRMHTAGDEPRWVCERVLALDEGASRRFAGVSQDTTVRKQAELRLRQADRHKDEFLAMLSHELRSPLAPVRSAVELLKANLAQSAPPDARALAIVSRQVGHLAELVDDLLDVSRINHGKIRLRIKRVRLDGVLNAALDAAEGEARARGHALTLNLPEASAWVDGDPTRLLQLFGNLLSNAIKFTRPGGHIEVGYRCADGAVRAWVLDDGEGVRPELAPRIFDIFIQEEAGLDRSQGGLGIGLALVRRLAEMHGGSVRLEPGVQGRGSRFVVELPALEAPAPPMAQQGAPLHAPTGRTLLVVDDNPDALEALTLVLQANGHTVHMAASGEEALSLAAAHRPDLVLLDIGLPGRDGYDVARALRAQPGGDATVLVALTGYGSAYDRERAAQAGFDHHVVKPADFDLLRKLIATLPAPRPGAQAPRQPAPGDPFTRA